MVNNEKLARGQGGEGFGVIGVECAVTGGAGYGELVKEKT